MAATMTEARWRNAVHYRAVCEGDCGEVHEVAVVKRRGKKPLRLCLGCYLDGFWRSKP